MLKLELIKMKIYLLLWITVGTVVSQKNVPNLIIGGYALSEAEMISKIAAYNIEAEKHCNENAKASWDVQTNVGDTDKQIHEQEVASKYAEFRKKHWEETWRDSNTSDYQNELLIKQLKSLRELGTAALEEDKFRELKQTTTKMSTIYSAAVICPYENKTCNGSGTMTLDLQIAERMAISTDYDELAYIWKEWRDNSGKLMREDYKTYVELMNMAAVANDYKDAGVWWQSNFDVLNLVNIVDQLWEDVKPLYEQLHTYVRYKLIEIYGDKINKTNPNIPAHILGNMWAQSWGNLYDKIKPYKDASLVDVTAKMKELNYTEIQMFEMSDEFYMSMGLPTNKMSYTGESIIVKPNNRTIACHASAWDFCNSVDFRIKMCTNINMGDFITIHHEMGHIQYYIQYKNVPLQVRSGANPAFHEAVGDTIALAVATPRHLQKINLLEDYKDTKEDNINALFSMALERVAFLPFGLLIDKWRWDVFSNAIPETQWNAHWWQLREKYQKVYAPVERSENDFDPGAKYHIPASSQYISYFLAHLLEFQMYKSLCLEAGEYNSSDPMKPLHKCDFYQSVKAGTKLSDGLKLGSTKHWSEALKAMTGETEVSGSAILEYFEPLLEFLKTENQRLEKEDQLRDTLATYNIAASSECTKLVTAEWNVATDTNNEEKKQALFAAIAANAKFVKDQYNAHFSGLNYNNYTDEKIRRQILYLSTLGRNILDDNKLNQLTKAINNMETIYNNAKVCPFDKENCDLSKEGLTLDPEITAVMGESTNFDELKYIWQQWYENSGRLMREDYKTYVALSNEAAVLNKFADTGDMWRANYEDPNFVENMQKLWNEIEPLYNELHTYVYHKLIDLYGDKINRSDPLIPAHLLGNMWAQSWVNIYERIKPFKESSDIDVTPNMVKQGYTAMKMFQKSDEFYRSLGLESNEMSYTGESIIEKPLDRVIVCHASAWDFCNGRDFRIKQCTTIDMNDFVTVHHEMGHIQYFILYKNQSVVFRTGANPGFHEAVGDLIALSVSTPTHLEKIGLLEDYKDSPEDNINALFKMALERLAFMPFGYLIDKYRWDIFSGAVKEDNWNGHWESLRETYQKIRSPVPRNETDFDAGGKYHVGASSEYINYFFAHILEFQLHRSLCITAGQYNPEDISSKPLSKCDIEGSLQAGAKLRAGLSLGLSKHWTDVLDIMTGERELKTDAIIEYFQPLYTYLKDQNEDWVEAVPDEDEGDDNLIPIIVGSVLGGVLVIGLGGYGFYYWKKKRN